MEEDRDRLLDLVIKVLEQEGMSAAITIEDHLVKEDENG